MRRPFSASRYATRHCSRRLNLTATLNQENQTGVENKHFKMEQYVMSFSDRKFR